MGAKSQSSSSSSPSVDAQLTERALKALLKHHESSSSTQKDQLLGNDLDIQVQFTLARIPGNASPKPIRIDIPHSLIKLSSDDQDDDDDDNVQEVNACIIVKEESKPMVQELITRFPKQLRSIKKVLGLQSLRTKHKSYTQRRDLLSKYDIFFADDSILPMLTKALGSKFFDKKKQPIPVRVSRKEGLPFAIQKALGSTFMYLSAGTCVTVKAGNTSMSPTKLLSNITSVTSLVPTKVPRKWSNIKSISIKTTNSVALPIYNKTPEELELICMLAKEDAKERYEEGLKNDAEDDGEGKGGKKEKKKRKIDTPLAKALKKQKAAEEETKKRDVDDGEEETKEKATKKSSKKKRKESIDTTLDDEAVVAKKVSKTPKSSKKKKRKESIGEEVNDEEKAKTPKSSKKIKSSSDDGDSNTSKDFISSKKFIGAKKGYVFKKSSRGLGYYKDVLPVVDKVALASLMKKSSGSGGRKSMGHGMKRKGKGGGRSRRSY